jgi:hypothetical protein
MCVLLRTKYLQAFWLGTAKFCGGAEEEIVWLVREGFLEGASREEGDSPQLHTGSKWAF